MIELVIFDADGVLFDSTLSNTAYYNAIFAAMDEPPMSPEEEKAGVYFSAPQVFEMRAGADLVRLQRMREIARTVDATPFFKMMIPALELRPFMTELKRNYRLGLATNRSATRTKRETKMNEEWKNDSSNQEMAPSWLVKG